jgi:hypothetical protein
MAVSYRQTDTNDDANLTGSLSFCSGTSNSVGAGRVASDGGTPGTGATGLSYSSSQTNAFGVMYSITPAAGTTWGAGNWTVRHNVTTANMNITIKAIYICRVNSSYVSQAIIGSLTGLATTMGTVGVLSFTVSGSAQTPSAGDKVVVMTFADNGAMSLQAASTTPDQLIDSPFTVSAALTLTAAAASYAISATATGLKRGLKVTAAAQSYTISATATNLVHGYRLLAVQSTYALAATATFLKAARKVIGTAQSYSISATSTLLNKGTTMLATASSYTLSATSTLLKGAWKVAAVQQTYSVTPTATGLKRGLKVVATASSYAISATATGLKRGLKVVATASSYALTPTATALKGAWKVAGTANSYSVTGTTTGLRAAWKVAAAAGAYIVSGVAVTLTKTVAAVINHYVMTTTPVQFFMNALDAEFVKRGQPEHMRRHREVLHSRGSRRRFF